MSRFLARALALLDAPKPPPAPLRGGFGGFGDFGEGPLKRIWRGVPDGYLHRLAARRRKAIAEGRDFWTAPDVLAEMVAAGLDAGEDSERIGQRRLPSWADAALTPLAGDWCACCGKSDRLGGRWWREATAPTGWRCATCHPAPPGMAVVEVGT